jgi:GTPase SAR1 family protein
MDEIDEFADGGVCRLLVGNKVDLGGQRAVSRGEGAALAERYQIPFFETSALEGTNVTEAFTAMAEAMVSTFGPPEEARRAKKCAVQ